MAANPETFPGTVPPDPQIAPARALRTLPEPEWDPRQFAMEQIRGLIRRVFFATASLAVKQVVFSALDSDTEVASICDQVGRALAQETAASVAVLTRGLHVEESRGFLHYGDPTAIKSWATRITENLWRVPEIGLRAASGDAVSGRYWLTCLAALRREFEYVVIQGPAAGISSEAALLGQLADGIVLVVGNATRKATARKVKETLQASNLRILGTVLSERRFPVPDRIYRYL
ncbi:MAG TPA: hypothetical protein VND65_12390 [Candidatus Binatia bacterium]|nr:hypothetical protein [Candidatus Binatia bacterium]